jgi:D-Tyr-tRNAtyr deacylase
MRAVVQRVASASVEVRFLSLSLALFVCLILRHRRMIAYIVQVEGRIVSEIGPGLLVLVGLHESDSDSDADYMFVFYFFPPF